MINRFRRAKQRKVTNINRHPWSPLQFYRNRKSRYDRLSLSRHAPTGGAFEVEITGDMDTEGCRSYRGGASDGDVEGVKSPVHRERDGNEDLMVDFNSIASSTSMLAQAPSRVLSAIVHEDSGAASTQDQVDVEEDVGDFVFAALTITLWGLSTYLALVYTDLALVLAFVGCVTAAMVGYIIPSALFFASYRNEVSAWLRHVCSSGFGGKGRGKLCPPRPPLVVPALLGVFGVSVMAIGLATLLAT
jgi:hypothetical protein